MTPIIEGITQAAVVIFYVGALTMGIRAFMVSTLWARRLSSAAVIATSVGWLYFYIFIVNIRLTAVHGSVLWSRIFHYNTATWLFIMGYVIWRSERVHRFGTDE